MTATRVGSPGGGSTATREANGAAIAVGATEALAISHCKGVTATGDPCQSRILVDGLHCNRHTPDPARRVDGEAMSRRGGLASVEVRREQAKSVRDRLRDRVEENVELIWGAFESALTSDDERSQLAGAVALLAEAYGKPAIAVTGGDQPVRFELVSLLRQAAGDSPEVYAGESFDGGREGGVS